MTRVLQSIDFSESHFNFVHLTLNHSAYISFIRLNCLIQWFNPMVKSSWDSIDKASYQ